MNEIVTKALESGLWATLFCVLFFYMLRDSRLRENMYISTIEQLGMRLKEATDALGMCEQIKADCKNGNRIGDDILCDARKIRQDVEIIDGKADYIKSEIEALRSQKELL